MSDHTELRYLSTWRVLGIAFIFVAMVASLAPYHLRSTIPQIDKLYHALTYTGLMFWFAQLYPRRQHVWLALGLVLLGVVIEGLQSLTRYRSAEWLDIVANSAGIGIGWALFQTPLGWLLMVVDRGIARYRELPDK